MCVYFVPMYSNAHCIALKNENIEKVLKKKEKKKSTYGVSNNVRYGPHAKFWNFFCPNIA